MTFNELMPNGPAAEAARLRALFAIAVKRLGGSITISAAELAEAVQEVPKMEQEMLGDNDGIRYSIVRRGILWTPEA